MKKIQEQTDATNTHADIQNTQHTHTQDTSVLQRQLEIHVQRCVHENRVWPEEKDAGTRVGVIVAAGVQMK